MAHTPGPWVVVNGTAVAPQWAPNERVAKTIAVNLRADEDGAFPEFGEWQHADAHLIAAAPELLARLKSMVSGAECECDKGDEEHPLCDICWSRQVIAKAEGRSE